MQSLQHTGGLGQWRCSLVSLVKLSSTKLDLDVYMHTLECDECDEGMDGYEKEEMRA